MSVLYDRIGVTYAQTRAADPRIVAQLITLLGLPSGANLIDIGAGTGNYSYALAATGYRVTAVEPSSTMRAQARSHGNLHWLEGAAEALPCEDGSMDGAVMTLCLHHFSDWRQGLREALRVVGTGPLVIFAFDVEFTRDFWVYDYFPSLITADESVTTTIPALRAFATDELNAELEIQPFPLPQDLQDHFLASGWARPEIYFEAKYRGGISSFAKLDAATITAGLAALRADLDNGTWRERYGHLLTQNVYDRGYLFLRLQGRA